METLSLPGIDVAIGVETNYSGCRKRPVKGILWILMNVSIVRIALFEESKIGPAIEKLEKALKLQPDKEFICQ
jgi:hypothetical protein